MLSKRSASFGCVEYLPLLIPLSAALWISVARPRPRAALLGALVAVLLEVPAIPALVDAGGIECPRGCGTGQSLLQGVVFLGLPLTALLLALWGLIAARRRRPPA